MDEFQALLAERLTKRGALAKLSERSEVPGSVIGRWRDGTSKPTADNLKKIAPYLGKTYEELLAMVYGARQAEGKVRRDEVEQEMLAAIPEFQEAVRDVPRVFWGTLIKATLRNGLQSVQDQARLLDMHLTEVSNQPAGPVRKPVPPASVRRTRPRGKLEAYSLALAR